MSKNNFKKVEFQIDDIFGSNFLCGETLLSYIKSNLSIDGNYVLVVKYISLYQSLVLKSNKFLDYNYLSSDYDRIITELHDSCLESHTNSIVCDIDFYCMENQLVQEEMLFSVIKHSALKNYHDDYCCDYDYHNDLDLVFGYITMYFIPVDNYTDEVLDNIINRCDI